MKHLVVAAAFGVTSLLTVPRPASAYDVDCAILLCMAGGFPPSAVCARAWRTMIQRITPWPSLPPVGICTYAAVPVALGGPGGVADLDTSLPEFAWLNRTHVIWFHGRSFLDSDDNRRFSWVLKSCDHENRFCHVLSAVSWSHTRWPSSFASDSGLEIETPGAGQRGNFTIREIMVEYGDHDGVMARSDWVSY